MDTLKEEGQEETLVTSLTSHVVLFWPPVLGILSILYVFVFAKRSKTHTKRPRPVVPIAPCGILETIRRFGDTEVPRYLLELVDRSGSDIYKLPLPLPIVKFGGLFVVGNPKAAREVLLDPDSDKPVGFYAFFNNVIKGPSMVTRSSKDAMFHASRKGAAPAFSSPEIKRMTRICNERLEEWMEVILEQKIAKNETFDPSEEMGRMLFFTVMEVVFEYDITESECKQVTESLHLALTELIGKDIANPLRVVFSLFIPSRRRAVRAATVVHTFMAKVLKEYREKKDKSTNNTIIKLVANNPEYKNDYERASEMVFLAIAAHDTTAFQLSSTLVLLAKHPQVAEKLRSELAGLDASEWAKSDYLHSVICESLRLLPSLPVGISREAGRTFYLKDGSIVIPKGAVITLPPYLSHRNRGVFTNPDTFDPERWMSPSNNQDTKDALMPFVLGSRNCLGQRLATTELYSCVPMIISKYRFEEIEEGKLVYCLTYSYHGTRLRAVKVA